MQVSPLLNTRTSVTLEIKLCQDLLVEFLTARVVETGKSTGNWFRKWWTGARGRYCLCHSQHGASPVTARSRSRSPRQGGSSQPLPPSPPTCQLRRPPARRVPLPTPYPLACARARARSRSPRQGGSSPPILPSPPTCQLRRPPARRVPLPTPYPLARA